MIIFCPADQDGGGGERALCRGGQAAQADRRAGQRDHPHSDGQEVRLEIFF